MLCKLLKAYLFDTYHVIFPQERTLAEKRKKEEEEFREMERLERERVELARNFEREQQEKKVCGLSTVVAFRIYSKFYIQQFRY